MDRDMSGRARAAAAAATEGEGSLRQGCRDALLALEQARTHDAIAMAVDLTAKHPNSPIAFNLAGRVFEIAGNRPLAAAGKFDVSFLSMEQLALVEGLSDQVDPYFRSALKFYQKASLLAPNCAVTAIAHGRMLARCDLIPEAFRELKRAIGLTSPTHPDVTYPWAIAEDTEPAMKKQMAKEAVLKEFNLFLGLTEDEVYNRCCDLIARHDVSTSMAAGVRREAKDLGLRYPFSARAQLLFPFLHKDFVRNLPLPPDADRSKLYRQLVHKLQECADVFNASIVVSLFRAELLTDVGEHPKALEECLRGLNIHLPDDPVDQDIPPGSVDGPGRAARVATVTEQLLTLLEVIEDRIAEANSNLQAVVDDPPNAQKPRKPQRKKISKGDPCHGKLPLKNSPLPRVPVEHPSPKDQGSRIKQSIIYRFSKLQKKKLQPDARPEQLVGTEVVPAETVDIYADYCRIQSRCSKYKVVCHMCVFEADNRFTCKLPQGDIIWHCNEIHRASGIECDVGGCCVRVREEKEASLHKHYCHGLPNDWWTRW